MIRTNAVASILLTAGLYETTGAWSLEVGRPAKSGVGGGIAAAVPGCYAFGTFSPPLDEAGNSARGLRAIATIVDSLGGNAFMATTKPLSGGPAAQRSEH